MEYWSIRKNKKRGYQKLSVWNDAIDYYAQTCDVFCRFPYENFLNIALGSLGESVSGLHASAKEKQITEDEFQINPQGGVR